MRWPWSRKPTNDWSISDPVLADYFGVAPRSYSGVLVSETSALGLSAFYRAVSLIAGTIAGLPMRTLRDASDGTRERVNSFLDNPGRAPDGPTSFEWRETVLLHLILWGNAYLAHVFSGGGALVGLMPVHPSAVAPEWETDSDGKPTGRKVFRVVAEGIDKTFDSTEMTQIPSMSLDGLKGLSLLTIARNSLGTAIAGDIAAGRMFNNGGMIAGMVTPEEDVTEEEAKEIKASLDKRIAGVDNAGAIAVINRKLKFSPWTMSAEDAQFLQSRQFEIEEIARWTGVPPHLLMQTEKQTSWGTGVSEQNRGLGRFTLLGWTTRMEQRLSLLLPTPRFVEFDFAGLERPDPETEIRLLIEQVNAGLITVNEARRIRNMDQIDGGDALRGQPAGQSPAGTPETEEAQP